MPQIERHCDVAIVGGSAAGLAAALQLSRQRRSVIVIDAGEPRNAPAAHMHSYLGYEGRPPAELLATGREEVRSYGGEVLTGRVRKVTCADDGRFRVEFGGGHTVVARRVIAATGLVDELPEIDGLAAHWGDDVIHCPFCHGYEVRDRRIVVIVTQPMGLHPVPLFRQLSARLTVLIHDATDIDAERLDVLRANGIDVREQRARRIVDTGGRLTAVELDSGETLPADAVVVGPRFRVRAEPFEPLGLTTTAHPSGMGEVVTVETTGATSVDGLYAAGNITDPSQQVLSAAADGARVGAMVTFSLADDDVRTVARHTANQTDWDHRYSGDRMWSGNPNGSLVAEASELTPGRALDVGAGEGGDAIWLAERGWTVTASDVSERALARIAAEAHRRDLPIECLHADANTETPYPAEMFDLVSAQYASLPRTPDLRGVHNVLNAVAPGGTVIVVGHDLEPMRASVDPEHGRPFDPDAYVRVADFATVLRDAPDWAIEVDEKRARPPGAASAAHHVDDLVLRARRRAG